MVLPVLRFPALLAALILAFPAGKAAAHPHAWIDATAVFHFDSRQRLAAIETRWLFDDMFSVYEVEGRDADRDGRLSLGELQPLADETVGRLAERGYFSVLKVGDRRVRLGPAAAQRMRFVGGRLDLTMTLPLAEPVDPKRAPLRFAMFDPTFYIEIAPPAEAPIRLSGDVPDGCRVTVERIADRSSSFVPDAVALGDDPDPDQPEAGIGAALRVAGCPRFARPPRAVPPSGLARVPFARPDRTLTGFRFRTKE